ncbi:MAG: ecotin [Planctomycetes bacterium]|nr:ecotin [Planctomycetota bacterium]
MRPVRVSLLALVTALAAVGSLADDAAIDPGALDNLEKAYPAAPEGMERKVILLPHKERGIDDDFRVELVVGRTVPTDGVNIHRFGGELDEVDIPGWGFSYYKVDGDLAQPASTRIAGTGETKPRFVPGPTRLVPYNSRLPLVVMVPTGCEVRWRLWRAAPEVLSAPTR